MDMGDIIRWEGLNNFKIQEALASFDNLDIRDSELIMPILVPDEALQTLNECLKAVEEGVANFLCAFPSTGKPLQVDKKVNLMYFSSNLMELKDEFRLPSFAEENMDEGTVVNKAWEQLRNVYKQMASTLLKTIKGSQWPSDMRGLLTTNEGGDEISQLSLVVRWTTKRLLDAGLLAKQLYGLVMAQLHLESKHAVYRQAFEVLNTYKISRGLRIAERGARISPEVRDEALALLTKEVKYYLGLQERWVKESESWSDDSMTSPNLMVHINYIDWALGVNHLETLLPEETTATKVLISDLLDFLPKIENMKGEFSNFESEVEVLCNRFYEQMNQIKHSLTEPGTTSLNPAEKSLDVPRQPSSALQLSMGINILIHEATALNIDLCGLTATYNKLEGASREDTIQMLKVRLEEIKRKKESMENLTEISKVYTMMDTIDKKISRLETFISLEEEKAIYTIKTREGMIQRAGKGRDLGSTRRLSRRCAFKNCKSTDHYTRQCDMNLKPGNVQENVQQLCQGAKLCLRCLWDLNYVNHDKTCKGGYRRKTDNKWVVTDCKTCMVTLPGGKVVSLNKRVCHHVIERVRSEKNQQRRDPLCFTRTLETKRIKELKEEGEFWDEAALPLGFSRIPNQTSLKFESKLMGASPHEDHHTRERGRNINQHGEGNTTLLPVLAKGIDTPSYIKMELTSPEPLDCATESAGEDEQPTTIGGEGTN